MPNTLSGHTARLPGSPYLRRKPVISPNANGFWITADRAALPLLLDLARKLSNKVQPLNVKNCWSYNYRPPAMGSGVSDHAGWAIDLWSGTVPGPGGNGIGAHTWPSRMPVDKARVIARVLEKYRTADGRHVFGWGIAKPAPGGLFYSGPTYNKTTSNDPMHFFIAPGITRKDLREARKRMGIRRDGTRKRVTGRLRRSL